MRRRVLVYRYVKRGWLFKRMTVEPVKSAIVSICDPQGWRRDAYVDADGWLDLTDFSPGTYYIEVLGTTRPQRIEVV